MSKFPPINWPSPESIQTVTQLWQADPGMFLGAGKMPVETNKYLQSPKIISWDVRGAVQGRTNAHVIGSDVKRVQFRSLQTKTERTAHWKEKITLTEEDLTELRNLGSQDRERRAGQLVMDAMEQIRIRTETRMESLRWDACFGQIDIDECGVKRTVIYDVAAATNVSVLWTDPALSNPLKDLQNEALAFRGTGGRRPFVWMTKLVANLLSQNDEIRDLVRQSGFVGQIGNEAIATLLPSLVGDIAGVIVYDEGYEDESSTFQTFLKDDHVYMVAEGPATEPFGEFASTPCIHNGGIDNARGGMFMFIDDHTDEANPYLDVVGGIYGLPVIFHPEWIRLLKVA